MDLITQNLIKTFKKDETLPENLTEDVIFEHFANFCVITSQYAEEFDLESIHTGGGDDLGIDGVAIVVNGVLITDLTEINDLATTNKYVDAEFIFCQAKSASTFSGSDISNFLFGVKDIFSETPTLPRNTRIIESAKLINAVYERSALFKKGNPVVRAFYITTGKWQDDPKLIARIATERDALIELDIFRDVEITPIDARQLQKLHARAKNRVAKSITFSGKVTLPALPGIDESYLGFLPADEYLKLITDDSGAILRSLFYDNVRDFQGDNPVNGEIDLTLKSSEEKLLFVLLNNGVTIVADSINKTGDTFRIEDYQIVNGCQTSHVLYNNSSTLGSEVQIPVKLIVSKDNEVKNRIIKATNRQTPVKTEELTALTDFQKGLEEYYNAISGNGRLHYERRSQQYRASVGIEKIRIITVSSQIRAFASMFLSLPHQASRYYGTLLKSIQGKIFVATHPPIAYYASALALYRFESFLRRRTIESKYRPFKYHLLAIVRMQELGISLPLMTSNKIEKLCDKIVLSLRDEQKCLAIFENAIKVLDEVLDGNYSRDLAKDANLLSRAESLISQTSQS